ncbi:fimbrial biogenesis chaperone [Sphingomonas sp. PAMC 26617]|uniref:fimbrial biogenesis chaperone n=1 Tax=Sphingomonas sp. PAMC 26617 TaxID=1112216 RepID=UPI0002898F24|nr:fimbria/pilus periplasmic chaperone [Sphingomonas sp. PAMC 26617]
MAKGRIHRTGRRRPLSLVSGYGIVLATSIAPLRAQSLSVSPVTLTLAAGQQATSLTVRNDAAVETVVQLRPFAWTQAPEDVLTPADDVIVSPRIVTIPPHSNQVFRLLVRHKATSRELTYRLLLDQIPRASEPGTVRMVLRLSLPIFVDPVAPANPDVRFRLASRQGDPVLMLENSGARHALLRNVVLHDKDGAAIAVKNEGSQYLLAGVTRAFAIQDTSVRSAPYNGYRLTMESGKGPIVVALAR